MESDTIDFVITWVDGGDKEWQKERNKYAGKDPEDLADYRFRDWDNLRYWFRGIEKYAPWVNNIYFVTNGQVPEWLNLNNPKLKWIKHEDYIPEEYLPTFSSHPIELNLHNITELSEHFVYFNDDTFLTDYVSKEDFFVNGLPRYHAQLDVNNNCDEQFEHIILNDAQFVNRYLSLDVSFRNNKKMWYDNTHAFKSKIKNWFLSMFHNICAIKNIHMPTPILKSTMIELWEKYPSDFKKTSSHKFRSIEDINMYVFSWYDLIRGNCMPLDIKRIRYFVLGKNDDIVSEAIRCKKYKMICVNDTGAAENYEVTKSKINSAFEEVLPDKCSYEL
ncbi:MAG: Stealth CR1 domain-containing protein [Clostridia bacterium]|nr:Stealth CR1 domain-containing protein [Clostridia bacterium]